MQSGCCTGRLLLSRQVLWPFQQHINLRRAKGEMKMMMKLILMQKNHNRRKMAESSQLNVHLNLKIFS